MQSYNKTTNYTSYSATFRYFIPQFFVLHLSLTPNILFLNNIIFNANFIAKGSKTDGSTYIVFLSKKTNYS